MHQNARTQPPGAYNYNQIVAKAEENFPDAFNALPDVDDMPWERPDLDCVGFSLHSLFLGHIVIDDLTHKVSAYITTEGNVRFFRRNISLSRRDNESIGFASLWTYLHENGERPGMNNLKALCGFYFLAAGYAEVVNVKKDWFRDLEVASRKVGVGLGVVLGEPPVSGVGRNSKVEGGDGERDVDGDVEENVDSGHETVVTTEVEVKGVGNGIDEVKVAQILQRLFIVVKTKQETWGERVEAELKWAWPDYKKYWR